MSKVDDHGLYDGRLSVLRAHLYPLRLDRVREADISRWMAACQMAGLIVFFEAGGKPFLKMLDTRWKARSAPKYPVPKTDDCKQLKTVVALDVVVDVVELKPYVGQVGLLPDARPPPEGKKKGNAAYGEEARQILAFLNEKAGKNFHFSRENIDFIANRLRAGATVAQCRQVIVKKCRDWGSDAKMREYLRPATLFNATKFSQYQGELVVPDVSRGTLPPDDGGV